VQDDERVVKSVLGTHQTCNLATGYHFVNPYTESLSRFDAHTTSLEGRQQDITTIDGVHLTVEPTICYQVTNAYQAVNAHNLQEEIKASVEHIIAKRVSALNAADARQLDPRILISGANGINADCGTLGVNISKLAWVMKTCT
jgi:regulator of protease activity HflC (stomatin/prohibitin superfamily)